MKTRYDLPVRLSGSMLRRQACGILGRLLQVLGLILFQFAFIRAPAEAASGIVVPRDYPTIQAAVNAAPAGATIKVSSGTFTEQVVITKNLTLVGAGIDSTIIQAPSTLTRFATITFNQAPFFAIVLVSHGATVIISGLTIMGPVPCGAAVSGIRVVENATLTFKDSHVTRIRPESSCTGFVRDSGVGLGTAGFVQMLNGQHGSTGHGIFTDLTIDKYQNIGIDLTSAGSSTATITNNTITGGPSPFLPVFQYGIFLFGGISAQVKENSITGNVCTTSTCGPDPITQTQSAGIIDSATSASIQQNSASGNDIGIYQFQTSNPGPIQENTLTNNRLFGIVIQDGDGATSQNTITGGQVGIGVVAGTQDTTGVLQGDQITQTSVMPIQKLSCCGFTATAIVK